MSGEYPAILKRRAQSMIRLAERLLSEGEYDLAVLNADYAVQLYVKALIFRVSGEEFRGHSVKVLMGFLASLLEEKGFRDLAVQIADYVRGNGRLLAELEEAHVRSVYGVFEYSGAQARRLVEAAKSLIQLFENVERGVFFAVTFPVFKALARRTNYARTIFEAVRRAVPNSQVYLTGGVAEGRLTALSDIDVVVVLDHEPSYDEIIDIRVRIMGELDRAEIPPYLPLDIHIVGVKDLKRYKTLIPLENYDKRR